MRILILGAGGIGGYFGGRLAAAGVDVTFLVRGRRAEQLARDGLVIASELGDVTVPVKTETRASVGPGYDAILLSCKAYDLEDAIESIRPAAPGALIVPLLNGMRHLERLDVAFGADAVTGGVAAIGVTLEQGGLVRHFGKGQGFIVGERSPGQEARCAALVAELAKGGFAPRHSHDITHDMWEKFVFLCTIASMCCLLRGSVGAIAGTDHGPALMADMLEDCGAAASAAGYPPRDAFLAMARTNTGNKAAVSVPSMMRDMLQGYRVEAEHIVGDMLARTLAAGRSSVLLRASYTQLQIYQASRPAGR